MADRIGRFYTPPMNDSFECPYCGQPKDGAFRADFSTCRFCGFRSAFVVAAAGEVLVVDRRMPFLKRRCRELEQSMPGVTVIVDRRIAQEPLTANDRRTTLQKFAV